MTAKPLSDAVVCFGITGDLAYKKIFPALHAMIRRQHLAAPIIGVARSPMTREQLVGRPRASIIEHGGLDEAAFATLAALLNYIPGESGDPETYNRLRTALGAA